jgi:hypothetical protein
VVTGTHLYTEQRVLLYHNVIFAYGSSDCVKLQQDTLGLIIVDFHFV